MRDHRHFLFLAASVDTLRLRLDPDETRHAVSVLRLRPGDPFLATDGAGTSYDCTLDQVQGGHAVATVTGKAFCPRHPCPIQLLVGLPERDAFESLVRDLTALGVERITPLEAAFCQRPWWRGGEEKLASRVRSKMVAAMKQSLYPWLPRLDPPVAFDEIDKSLFSGFPIVADQEGAPFSSAVRSIPPTPPYTCIVGPPGGFSQEEIGRLRELGALPVRLAASRLTTELASVVMASELLGMALR